MAHARRLQLIAQCDNPRQAVLDNAGLSVTLSVSHSQPPALNQLVSLYLGRTHSLWKDPAVMAWLETNVHEVLRMVDASDLVVEESAQK